MGINVKNLVKTYGDAPIVHGISFTVENSEFVTLLGPSGCGKTTTLRCIAGLERTNAGVIEIDGHIVSDVQKDIFVAPHERNLGMVFQSYAIWPHMTVQENVSFPLTVRGIKDTDGAVAWAIQAVGLSAQAHRQPSELSGGQQQRVALARAIVGRPKVLLFDEPLSNLDARLRDKTRTEISRIQRELSIPAIYVTHDQAEALSMSDRIIVMNAGNIVEQGTPKQLYRWPATRFAAEFIGAANFLSLNFRDGHWMTADGCAIRLDGSEIENDRSAGNTRQAMVRCEAIDVCPADTLPEQDQNLLKGTVVSVQFLGAHFEYVIEVNGVRLHALAANEFSMGAGVCVLFHSKDIHLFPDTTNLD